MSIVIPFRKTHQWQLCNRVREHDAGFTIELPADLAGRIGAAAIWTPKSSHQLALDTLAEAFPPGEGA